MHHGAGRRGPSDRSLSICLWAWPTRLRTGAEQPLFSGGSAVLLIDATGLACFHIHTDHGHAEVRTERPLNERVWTLLCGSYDAQAGRLALTAREVGLYASERETVEHWVSPADLKALDSTLYIAAQANTGARSTTWGISHYDGKLEAPTLYDRALSERDIDQIASGEDESAFPPDGLAAAWRFQHGMEGDRITDVGPHALHGLAINSPSRAMTGHILFRNRRSAIVNCQNHLTIEPAHGDSDRCVCSAMVDGVLNQVCERLLHARGIPTTAKVPARCQAQSVVRVGSLDLLQRLSDGDAEVDRHSDQRYAIAQPRTGEID
jgi:hypothetical protein